jgi:hypothetical protein
MTNHYGQMTESQQELFYKEHSELVDKKFFQTGGLTPREKRRLAIVRWWLDRIEEEQWGGIKWVRFLDDPTSIGYAICDHRGL